MSDDPEAMARGDGPAGHLLPPRLRLPDPGPDPARLAWQVLEAVVPGFADGAGLFVLEHLLSGGNPEGQAAETGPAGLVVRRLAAGSAVAGTLVAHAAFPPGEVIAFGAGSPCTRCVRDAAPVIFARPDRARLQRFPLGGKTTLAHYKSFLAAPMITRGTAAGLLVLARTPGTPAFRGTDMQAAADLAARAGGAVAGALALMRHRSVAEALQPPRPAVSQGGPGHLEIAGRCLPAAGYGAGGDWYDIVPLPRERTGLIVGDAMGHGPQAVTVMARLSAVGYALADLDLAPAELLRQLNRTAVAMPRFALATCVYAVIDQAGQSCVLATAGHLPPVLAMPDGTTTVPDLPGGQLLGIGPADYAQARITLPPGAVLALYTDGLVETRTRPFDQGILALRSVLARRHRHLDAACEDIIASLAERYEDDITVVLASIPRGLICVQVLARI